MRNGLTVVQESPNPTSHISFLQWFLIRAFPILQEVYLQTILDQYPIPSLHLLSLNIPPRTIRINQQFENKRQSPGAEHTKLHVQQFWKSASFCLELCRLRWPRRSIPRNTFRVQRWRSSNILHALVIYRIVCIPHDADCLYRVELIPSPRNAFAARRCSRDFPTRTACNTGNTSDESGKES